MRTLPRAIPVLVLGLVLGSLGPATAATPPAETGAAAGTSDPLLRDVLRMLDGGVASDVILEWLARDGRAPGSIGPDELIALTRAGASNELLQRLIGMTGARVESAAAESATTAEPGSQAAPEVLTGGQATLALSLAYRPFREADDVPHDPWDLLAYVDGRPWAWTEERGSTTVSLRRELAAGTHVVRLLQEQHTHAGKGGWKHAARVCPESIVVVLEPGSDASLDLTYTEPLLSGRGRLAGTLAPNRTAAGRPVPDCGDAESWPLLCEEIEANLVPGEKPPRSARKRLDECVRWGDLWQGVAGVPERSAVRETLSVNDFRPFAGNPE